MVISTQVMIRCQIVLLKAILQCSLKLFTGLNFRMAGGVGGWGISTRWNSECVSEALNCINSNNRCWKLIPLHDGLGVERESVKVFSCLLPLQADLIITNYTNVFDRRLEFH